MYWCRCNAALPRCWINKVWSFCSTCTHKLIDYKLLYQSVSWVKAVGSLQRFGKAQSCETSINCCTYSLLCIFYHCFQVAPGHNLTWWVFLLNRPLREAQMFYMKHRYSLFLHFSLIKYFPLLKTRIYAKAVSPREGSPTAAFGFAHHQVRMCASPQTLEGHLSYYYVIMHTDRWKLF